MIKNTTQKLRRPLIDINPDAPLRFHGFRIARDGTVYATTTRMTHGRPNPNYEVFVGTVAKQGRIWSAKTFDGQTGEFASQADAGKWVERTAEATQ